MPTQPWLRSLVWLDYRLAVLLAVVIPLILLIWAIVGRAEAMQRLLIIYWRVSSLLAITVYLMIASLPVSFITALLARILIPLSLWFWVDLNEEISDQPSSALKFSLTSWRWATSLYLGLGVLPQIPLLQCAILSRTTLLENQLCRVWLEPPWGFKALFHPNPSITAPFLGFLGIVGLVIYALYLGHFVIFRLAKQGRLAFEE
jgi:hypothetical protein